MPQRNQRRSNYTDPQVLERTWGTVWGKEDVAGLEVSDTCSDSWTSIHKPAVDRWLPTLPPGPILEMGSGLGQWTRYYARSRAGVGIDIVPEAVERAQQRALQLGLRNASFVRGDARELPFDDNTFAGISSFGVIEHFEEDDLHAILLESFRVLAQDGQLLVSTPNVWCAHSITRPILKAVGKWHLGLERSFSPAGLRRRIEKAGFKCLSFGILESGLLFGGVISGRFRQFDRLSRAVERRQSLLGFVSYAIGVKSRTQ